MANNFSDTINNANQRGNIRVNPLDYPSIPCDKCGCEFYKQVVVFKKIPGVAVGSGSEPVIYPIPVYVCEKCGELMSEYKKDMDNEKDSKASQTNSNIIL